jgi:hypothetical protein
VNGRRKITLQAWAEMHYDPAPGIGTLRAWARDARILPPPQKIGRTYYVHPDARHIDDKTNNMAMYTDGSAAA